MIIIQKKRRYCTDKKHLYDIAFCVKINRNKTMNIANWYFVIAYGKDFIYQ